MLRAQRGLSGPAQPHVACSSIQGPAQAGRLAKSRHEQTFDLCNRKESNNQPFPACLTPKIRLSPPRAVGNQTLEVSGAGGLVAIENIFEIPALVT